MKFATLAADPPWQYRNARTGGSLKSGSSQHYATLPTREISALNVYHISEKDAVLFLWATAPLLDEAFHVMESWGFKYKTFLAWRKTGQPGLGYWFRGSMELCLIGTRGHPKPFRCQQENFIQSKRRAHSQKPAEFWDLVTPITPEPRIELYCRGDPPAGWYGWGNQCNNPMQDLWKPEWMEDNPPLGAVTMMGDQPAPPKGYQFHQTGVRDD